MDFLRNAMYNGREEIARQKNNRGFMLYTASLLQRDNPMSVFHTICLLSFPMYGDSIATASPLLRCHLLIASMLNPCAGSS